jgi:hypothetical protein
MKTYGREQFWSIFKCILDFAVEEGAAHESKRSFAQDSRAPDRDFNTTPHIYETKILRLNAMLDMGNLYLNKLLINGYFHII